MRHLMKPKFSFNWSRGKTKIWYNSSQMELLLFWLCFFTIASKDFGGFRSECWFTNLKWPILRQYLLILFYLHILWPKSLKAFRIFQSGTRSKTLQVWRNHSFQYDADIQSHTMQWICTKMTNLTYRNSVSNGAISTKLFSIMLYRIASITWWFENKHKGVPVNF